MTNPGTVCALNSDTVSLAVRPSPTSALVVESRKELEATLDVRTLGGDLVRVVKLLSEATRLSISEASLLRAVKDDVLKLFYATREILAFARNSARAVLSSQSDIVAFFGGGLIDEGINLLKRHDASAQQVSERAEKLAAEVAVTADVSSNALESLLKARDQACSQARESSDAAERLQLRRAQAWHSHSALLSSLNECGKLYKSAIYDEKLARRKASFAGMFSFMHSVDNVLGASCGIPVLAPVSTYLRGFEDEAKEKHNETRALLSAKRRQRALSRAALDDLADASRAIKAISNDAANSEDVAKALHAAATELRRLSALVLRVEGFWGSIQRHMKDLTSSDYSKLVKQLEKPKTVPLPNDEDQGEGNSVDIRAHEAWKPLAPIKRRHVQYFSKWAALEEVCDSCMKEVDEAGRQALELEPEPDTMDITHGDGDDERNGKKPVEVIDLTDDAVDGATAGREAAARAAEKAAED